MHVVRAVRANDVDELVDVDTIVHAVSLVDLSEIRSLPPREPRRLFSEPQPVESGFGFLSGNQDRGIGAVDALAGCAGIYAERRSQAKFALRQ